LFPSFLISEGTNVLTITILLSLPKIISLISSSGRPFTITLPITLSSLVFHNLNFLPFVPGTSLRPITPNSPFLAF
jgi:hypothetical protein